MYNSEVIILNIFEFLTRTPLIGYAAYLVVITWTLHIRVESFYHTYIWSLGVLKTETLRVKVETFVEKLCYAHYFHSNQAFQ